MTARSIGTRVLAVLLILAAVDAHAQTTRNIETKAHFDDYNLGGFSYSACWSYIHGDGREYAVLGTRNGTAIYNVTDPGASTFVGFIPGKPSVWREMKSYRNWIYVVTEEFTANAAVAPGLQIIRMTDPESPVLAATYAVNFQTSHTVSIDSARAILICNGTRSWPVTTARGIRILSLANPEAPVEIGRWPTGTVTTGDYVHDSVPIGNRLYASSITTPGFQRIFDFTDPAAPVQLNAWSYSGAFTHNSWPDASGNFLYVTDETNGQPLKIFDISNVADPVLVNAITSNPLAIVHNAHVLGNELYLSNYTEGIRILDLDDPAHPAEFAWADSWPGTSGGFHGVWEVCPYFPSGTVIASDIETGLYVYRPVRDFGRLRVQVLSQLTGMPVPGAVVVLSSQGDSLTTTADGIVQFAPSPGTHTVFARKFFHVTDPVSRLVSTGSRDTIVIEIPALDLTGSVRQAGSLVPLEEAEVELDQPAIDLTDAQGQFALDAIPEGAYTIQARSPGHISRSLSASIAASDPTVDFQLRPTATWDALEVSSGWTVGAPGDNATLGIWTRVDPLGTGSLASAPQSVGRAGASSRAESPDWNSGGMRIEHDDVEEATRLPGSVQPEIDRSPPPGTMCFVTGQGANPYSPGEQDVDGGATTLTSPALDLTGMAQPTIGYWRWFYGAVPPDDWLAVSISNDNGASWVPVETVTGILNSWKERTVRVADFVAPTNQVRVRFVAADFGSASLVEAAIDDLVTFDAATPAVGAPGTTMPKRLAFLAPRPNPSAGTVGLALELPRSGLVDVEVLDLTGRRVRLLHHGVHEAGILGLSWNGADGAGRDVAAGLFFVRARAGETVVMTRIVRVR